MSRRETVPDFNRLRRELAAAEEAWQHGEHKRTGRILRLLASLAYADSYERNPTAPIPEGK